MSNTEELDGLTYIGDAPMVYKHSAYEIYYSHLYVRMVGDKPFFAIKTDDSVEAIALCKPGKKQMLNRDVPFDFNAENDNVCVNTPNYGF